MAEDCRVEEAARGQLGAPTSVAAVVLSVNYRKMRVVVVVDKENNRSSRLL